MALELISRTGTKVVGGRPSVAEVDRARDAGVKTIRLDAGSFDHVGADMRWVEDIPTLRTVFLHGRVRTPDIRSMQSSTVSELCVWTDQASPVRSDDVGWLWRIDCEAESFVSDGWVGMPNVEKLFVGRVKSQRVRIGDGCDRLEFMKLQGRLLTASIEWSRPPVNLDVFMSHGIRWRNLDDLARCASVTSVQAYNASLDVSQGSIDISAFAQTKTLKSLDVASNFPITGVPAALDGAPLAKVYVSRDFHDAPADATRIHNVTLPIKKQKE